MVVARFLVNHSLIKRPGAITIDNFYFKNRLKISIQNAVFDVSYDVDKIHTEFDATTSMNPNK